MGYRIILAAALALFVSCAKGEDGKDGNVYAYIDWSSDIDAADFTAAGVPSPFFSNTRYQLRPGPARLYWHSTLYPSTNWYLDVVIEDGTEGESGKDATLPLIGKAEDGEDGQDRVYEVYLSGNTLYVNEYLTEIGTASTGHSALDVLPSLPDGPQPTAPGGFRDLRAPGRG